MNNIKTFDLSFGTIILRFYLMMGVVIVAGFSGYWLIAFLALPIFLSIMMGVSFQKDEMNSENKSVKNSSPSNASKVNFPNLPNVA